MMSIPVSVYQSVMGNLSNLTEPSLVISPSQLASASDHVAADDLPPIHMDTDVDDIITPSASMTLRHDESEVTAAFGDSTSGGATVKLEEPEPEVEFMRIGGRTIKVVKLDPGRLALQRRLTADSDAGS